MSCLKYFTYIFLCFTGAHAVCQDTTAVFDGKKWQAPYTLSIPAGWDVERFPLPPAFAPQVTCHGIEDIRFTPGWGNATANDYWSYAFLWWLDGFPVVNEKTMARDLENYYTGLIKSNLDPRKMPASKIPPTKTSIRKIKTAAPDNATYTGTVNMFDYMQKKEITLNCLIHLKKYTTKKKTIVFCELSPQSFSNDGWQKLNQLWKDFRYE